MFRTYVAAAVLVASPALAQTCYRLPFSNPNLADGWGSTCCGRTNPHRGVDFPQASGTSIPAVGSGVVRLKTFSSCLGNVIVIDHGDGYFSGYSHMLTASPLAVGTPMEIGQIIGRVGSTGTCTTGPHLHLSMAPTLGGYGSGTTVDPYKFIIARTTCNKAPIGALDAASCTGISGWAQDPNVPSSAIPAHVYIGGPAGSPAARGFNLQADKYRSDLCTAIGSCSHGFSMATPLGYFDGVDHPVFAYGIDSAGGPNPVLGQKTLRCEAAPLPVFETGAVRRHVPGVDVLTAWKLGVGDIAPIADAVLDAIPLGPEVSAAPVLVKADGAPDIFVREYGVLRHVVSIDSMDAWKFGAYATVPAAEVQSALRGAAWPTTPFLARGSGDKVYLLDAAPPLWAEPVSDDLPGQLAVGTTADVTFRFRNKGSHTWGPDVALAPTPRDLPAALCDSSWASCTRAGAFTSEVLPGKEGIVTVKLRAPATVGPASVCFSLVRGETWFSDPGQNGPADDGTCRTVQIVPAGTVVKPGAAMPAGPGATPVAGGCSQSGGSAFAFLALLLGIALSRRALVPSRHG